MAQQKYIRVDALGEEKDVILLIPPLVGHNSVAFRMNLSDENLISAGFVQSWVEDGHYLAKCHGKSVTLDVSSKPEDTDILNGHYFSPGQEQKYVRFEELDGLSDAIILFPNTVEHAELVQKMGLDLGCVMTAGFFEVGVDDKNDLKVECYGHSYSLNIGSDPSDADVLKEQHYDPGSRW